MNSLVYIKLREKKIRRKDLKDDENSQLCEDMQSADDITKHTLANLQQKDLNVDFFHGQKK